MLFAGFAPASPGLAARPTTMRAGPVKCTGSTIPSVQPQVPSEQGPVMPPIALLPVLMIDPASLGATGSCWASGDPGRVAILQQ